MAAATAVTAGAVTGSEPLQREQLRGVSQALGWLWGGVGGWLLPLIFFGWRLCWRQEQSLVVLRDILGVARDILLAGGQTRPVAPSPRVHSDTFIL